MLQEPSQSQVLTINNQDSFEFKQKSKAPKNFRTPSFQINVDREVIGNPYMPSDL